MTPEELFAAAARCYLRAGWADEASSCFEAVGQWLEAARCLEQSSRWREAAHCFESGGEPLAAARCFLRAGDHTGAARNLERGGRLLEAAWLVVHRLGEPLHALALLDRIDPDLGGSDAVARSVVSARCELALGRRERASEQLVQALSAPLHPSAPSLLPLAQLHDSAVDLAELLARPDLAIRAHTRFASGARLVDWEQRLARLFSADTAKERGEPAAQRAEETL